MKTKALIAIAAGALVCGAWGSTALANTHHAKKKHATHVAATQPQQAPTLAGNNPIKNASPAAPVQNAQQPSAIPGNNPMRMK